MVKNIIKVFISYAHESDAFKASIFEFAQWLIKEGKGRIKVVTDHLHSIRPPKEGWITWMHHQIEDADFVLMVCTPKYYQRFSRREANPDAGRGVIFEGAIITQSLYNSQLNNDKFHPITPDGGPLADVPIILQQYFNYFSFPSKNGDILKCILNENPVYEYPVDLVDETTQVTAANEELEKEILTEITNNIRIEKSMLSNIQILVRSFLSLSDVQKIAIAKKLGVYKNEFNTLSTVERDKEVFKLVKEKNIMEELWQSIHTIKPFTNKINPFKQ